MQSATLVGEEGDVVEAGEQEGSEAWSDARERGCLGETSTRTTVQCHPSRVVQQTSIIEGKTTRTRGNSALAVNHWRENTFLISAPHQDCTLDEDVCCATQGGVHVTHERVDMEIVQKKTAARGLVAVSAVK